MRRLPLLLLVAAAIAVVGLPPVQGQVQQASVAPFTLRIIHLNDVYEILPVEGGKSGGLARVATVFQQYRLRSDAPVITTLGGDYLSPSALGTAKVDGQPLAGRQMVDVLNAAHLDWATFGNHEFDVSEAAFRAHLAQATFKIVSTNVTDANGQPFPGVPTSAIVPFPADGRTIRIGLVGVTLGATKKPWVKYREPIVAAQEEVAKLKGKVDAIVALTHLSLAQDAEFVAAIPEIDVVLGGHEHENWELRRGPHFTPIIKADANVRSLAIVSLRFGAPGTRPAVSSTLQLIDDTIASDVTVDAVARRWTQVAFDAFRKDGFAPDAVVATTTEPLDGRESTVRNRAGRLTDLITQAQAAEVTGAQVAVFNGGSVRIDDVVPAGPITEYDIIRVLPFGGKIVGATLDGALLARVLDTGVNNQGIGGYLHVWGAKFENGAWAIGGTPIDPAGRYRVALTDFLLSGGETNLGFLTRTNPGVGDVQEFRDVRRAVIEKLAATYRSAK
jgi:5'-nucleotidase / UDP-sugar diphosphatase